MSANLLSPPHSRKPRGQGASRRGEILAEASRIFLAEGVGGATMRRIAAAVGVSPTALYVYFPDKDSILGAIAEATFTQLLAALEASQAGAFGPERFRAGMWTYIRFGLDNPDAYRLTFLQRLNPCETIPAADRSFAILQTGVEAMMAAGLFRSAPSGAVTEALWACMHGVTALLLDQAEHVKTPAEELIERTLDMLISGLR